MSCIAAVLFFGESHPHSCSLHCLCTPISYIHYTAGYSELSVGENTTSGRSYHRELRLRIGHGRDDQGARVESSQASVVGFVVTLVIAHCATHQNVGQVMPATHTPALSPPPLAGSLVYGSCMSTLAHSNFQQVFTYEV